MSLPTHSRAASAAEPRRTSAAVRAKSRASAALDPDNRPDANSAFTRRSSAVTTETRVETRIRDERVVTRTRSPLKPTDNPHLYRQPRPQDSAERSKRKSASVSPAATSWAPCATLVPPTSSAPLAGRISIPPLSRHAPPSLRADLPAALSMEKQEKALMEDLLYVLMGFEGRYVTFDASYNPLEEQSRLLGPTFVLAHGLDPSLRDLSHGMIKTATHYAAVEAFCEVMGRAEAGAVAHALCAAMRALLKDYLILIAQLEHQMLTNDTFTLHQMNLHLRPTAPIMAQLHSLAQELLQENGFFGMPDSELDRSDNGMESVLASLREGRDTSVPETKACKGGAALRLVSARLQRSAGDPAASQLLSNLLHECSRPYVRMLNEWLHHGNVRDPHQEFLIKEQKSIRREGLQQDYIDQYWEKRYSIIPGLVPPQLDAVQERVLLAGKYLNVVRECGGITDVDRRNLSDKDAVPQTLDDPRFLSNVSDAYTLANRRLMSLLLTTHHLPRRLRSLKHYFFLDRSDFFNHFLDLAAGELRKPGKNANVGRLQSLLDIALRQPGSVAADDPFKEDVRVTMSNTGLTGWLMRIINVQGMDADASSFSLAMPVAGGGADGGKEEKAISGHEALTLDYAVPFPLSLIISRNTLTRYQLLFRYLLSLRHLEMQLTNAWTEHTKNPIWTRRTVRSSTPGSTVESTSWARKLESWKRRIWCLRSRMLCFVQQLLYYCTSEVIEPNWAAFMRRLSHSSDDKGDDREGTMHEQHDENASRLPEGRVKRTVDELMRDHVDFLATCLKECMLTNGKLLRINAKVTSTCAHFAAYASSASRYLSSLDPSDAPPSDSTSNSNSKSTASAASSGSGPDPAKMDRVFSVLAQYESYFASHLRILVDALNYLAATETGVFLGLCARLSMAIGEGAKEDVAA